MLSCRVWGEIGVINVRLSWLSPLGGGVVTQGRSCDRSKASVWGIRHALCRLFPRYFLVSALALAVVAVADLTSAQAEVTIELSNDVGDAFDRAGMGSSQAQKRLAEDVNKGLQAVSEDYPGAKALLESGQKIRIICAKSKEAKDLELDPGFSFAETRGDFGSDGKPKKGGTAVIAIKCKRLARDGLDKRFIDIDPTSTGFGILVHEILHATDEARKHPPDKLSMYVKFVTDFTEALKRLKAQEKLDEKKRRSGAGRPTRKRFRGRRRSARSPQGDQSSIPGSPGTFRTASSPKGFNVSFSPSASRVENNSDFGGGVQVFGGNEIFATSSPRYIWRAGGEVSASFDLDGANPPGIATTLADRIGGGAPKMAAYVSAAFAMGYDTDRLNESDPGVDYGIVFAQDLGGITGYGLYDGAIGFGLNSATRTENTWFRIGTGFETEIPNSFGNRRLRTTASAGVFLETYDTEFDVRTIVTFGGVDFAAAGEQRTAFDADDRYFGVKLGGGVSYLLTDRFSVAGSADIYLGYRTSSAEFRQRNTAAAPGPLGDFEIRREFNDDGVAVGFGLGVQADYRLSDMTTLSFSYRRSTLPGVSTVDVPQNPAEQPIGFDSENVTREFGSIRVLISF